MVGLNEAPLQARIRWQRGVADGYSTISEETLIIVNTSQLTDDNWNTYITTTAPKPAEALQARIRFVLLGGDEATLQGVGIDLVVVTTIVD
ncbi:hypothetical protein [Paenibacillus humicola]|uniref:hypothetical protein n=1 Tax=Paenibacillus humicola TaxID=3110540 RepID=UPI00237A7602|nr:hypothetical protein [Paenibacillus humicola]